MARPTLYRAEYAGKALALCRLGVDKPLLARFFAVSLATLYCWLVAHPDFAAAVEAGAAEAVSPIKPTMFQCAAGYRVRVARVFLPRRRGAAPVVGYYTRRCSPTRRSRYDGYAIAALKNGVSAISSPSAFLKRQVIGQDT